MAQLASLLILLAPIVSCAGQDYPPPCDSPVYCLPGPGNVLHTVQMAKLFPDSKTFVDMPMTRAQVLVLQDYATMMHDNNDNPSNDTVLDFVNRNFGPAGTEFEPWTPDDWIENPKFLDGIQDAEYKAFATDIHGRWKDLGRKIPDSLEGSDSTTLIYVEHPFVVPGGRFREMYYWDSYWTILGLLQSEMVDTARGMLHNFARLIEDLGFIPNGNRLYYTRRSQPPLFISMVDEYVKATADTTFVVSNINALDAEFHFWMNNRTRAFSVNGEVFQMASYDVEVDGPRPESYYEDYTDAQAFSSEKEKLEFYMNMKSGAESGWDYSSKWFIDLETGGGSGDLLDNKARHIVPVELNSYLCRAARVMRDFYADQIEDDVKAQEYQGYYDNFYNGIKNMLWNSDDGIWYDYNSLNNTQRKFFFPSNVAPFWAGCFEQDQILPAIQYLQESGALDYPGGVPTSLENTGQQWDYTNGWPPLQELLVTGLENTGNQPAAQLALNLAQKWVRNNWATYEQTEQIIFEKYNVSRVGPGGQGEYDVQEGFGWTNGVLLSLFAKYGDRLSSEGEIQQSSKTTDSESSSSLMPSSTVTNASVVGALPTSFLLLGACLYCSLCGRRRRTWGLRPRFYGRI